MLALMRRYEPLFGIDGVVSGGNATIKIPNNRRALGVRIFGTATIGGSPSIIVADMIQSITQIVNGKEIRVEDSADIVSQRAFYKLPTDSSGALTLYYMEPHRADVNDETLPAWPLYGDSEITLKVKMKTGLTNPSLNAILIYDQGAFKNEAGAITKQIVKRYSVTKSGGTLIDFTNMLGTPGRPLLGVYFRTDGAQTIDSCKVTVDDTVVIHEMTRVQNNAMLADYNLDGTAFKYCLRFDIEGQIFNRLQDFRSLNVRLALSAAADVTAIVEEVAPDYV